MTTAAAEYSQQVITKPFTVLASRDGEQLRADVRYVCTGRPKPVVIFLHGFKGFKDWGPFPSIRDKWARAGFVTVAINFSHNGVGADLETFTELDRFARNTFSRELSEVEDTVRQVGMAGGIPVEGEEYDASHIGVVGHSRGAGMALLSGSRMPEIRAVAALSSVSTFDRYSERARERWRREGKFDVINQRTKQVMRLNSSFLEDLEAHRDTLDILAAAKRYPELRKPLLVLCGAEDLTTPLAETNKIVEAAHGPHTELVVIPHVGHTFGAEHPFRGMTPALEAVSGAVSGFFSRALKEEGS